MKDNMIDMNNKNIFIKFAQIADKAKTNTSEGNQLSVEDTNFIKEIKNTFGNDPEYSKLIEEIVNAPYGQSKQVVENYFAKLNEQKKEEEKSPEEEIAKVFGVSTDQVKHLYLNNGKEIFYFYSAELGKDIVLENDKKGKMMSEILEEIQNNNEKYQSDNPDTNTNDIMMDTRLNTNMELAMYPPEEVPNHEAEINELNADEIFLLRQLLNNADKLDIKLINIQNLFYIDSNHEVKEITFDMDFKPTIASPTDEANADSAGEIKENDEMVEDNNLSSVPSDISSETNDESNELDDMFNMEEEEKDDNIDANKKEEKKEQENVKKLVFYKENGGFVTITLLVVALSSIIALLILLFTH